MIPPTDRSQEPQKGFTALARVHRLRSAALFHKKRLDGSRLGMQVADHVGHAIEAVAEQPLVACVLNTIDDALDRSDPGGTDWTLDDIKHLRPLLERARAAGRAVIITADHGHIVERRQGVQRPHRDLSSGRSRADDGTIDDGEVLVTGRRVLLHGGRAVLAVDERLRYSALKAGYHGGASPAEAIVPVIFLLPAGVSTPRLRDSSTNEPSWWQPLPVTAAVPEPVPSTPQQELFPLPPPAPAPSGTAALDLVDAVLASRLFAAQQRLGGRARPDDPRIRSLLTALIDAPGARLPESTVASLLGVGQPSVRGAVAALQRLLNVEGYPVLDVDADGSTVVLDVSLLREQFGVRA